LLHCAAPLLSCELNAQCRAWSLCNVGCALHREPAQALACQIRCQDLYKPTDAGAQGFAEITAFSECAISDYHCVPQTRMTCSQPSQVADSFRLEEFVGKWYITRGLNPLFDCFDCQVKLLLVLSSSLHAELASYVQLLWSVPLQMIASKLLPLPSSFREDMHVDTRM